jgi:hypothetical protein
LPKAGFFLSHIPAYRKHLTKRPGQQGCKDMKMQKKIAIHSS